MTLRFWNKTAHGFSFYAIVWIGETEITLAQIHLFRVNYSNAQFFRKRNSNILAKQCSSFQTIYLVKQPKQRAFLYKTQKLIFIGIFQCISRGCFTRNEKPAIATFLLPLLLFFGCHVHFQTKILVNMKSQSKRLFPIRHCKNKKNIYTCAFQ